MNINPQTGKIWVNNYLQMYGTLFANQNHKYIQLDRYYNLIGKMEGKTKAAYAMLLHSHIAQVSCNRSPGVHFNIFMYIDSTKGTICNSSEMKEWLKKTGWMNCNGSHFLDIASQEVWWVVYKAMLDVGLITARAGVLRAMIPIEGRFLPIPYANVAFLSRIKRDSEMKSEIQQILLQTPDKVKANLEGLPKEELIEELIKYKTKGLNSSRNSELFKSIFDEVSLRYPHQWGQGSQNPQKKVKKNSENFLEKNLEKFSENNSEKFSENNPEKFSEKFSEKKSENNFQKDSQINSENNLSNNSENKIEDISENKNPNEIENIFEEDSDSIFSDFSEEKIEEKIQEDIAKKESRKNVKKLSPKDIHNFEPNKKRRNKSEPVAPGSQSVKQKEMSLEDRLFFADDITGKEAQKVLQKVLEKEKSEELSECSPGFIADISPDASPDAPGNLSPENKSKKISENNVVNEIELFFDEDDIEEDIDDVKQMEEDQKDIFGLTIESGGHDNVLDIPDIIEKELKDIEDEFWGV